MVCWPLTCLHRPAQLGLDGLDPARSAPLMPPRPKRARTDADAAQGGLPLANGLPAGGLAPARDAPAEPGAGEAGGSPPCVVPVYPESLFAIRQQAERAAAPCAGGAPAPDAPGAAASAPPAPAADGPAAAAAEAEPRAPSPEPGPGPAGGAAEEQASGEPGSGPDPDPGPGMAPRTRSPGAPTLGMHDIRSALGKSLGLLSPSFSAQLRRALASEAPAAARALGGSGGEPEPLSRSMSAAAPAGGGAAADRALMQQARWAPLADGAQYDRLPSWAQDVVCGRVMW